MGLFGNKKKRDEEYFDSVNDTNGGDQLGMSFGAEDSDESLAPDELSAILDAYMSGDVLPEEETFESEEAADSDEVFVAEEVDETDAPAGFDGAFALAEEAEIAVAVDSRDADELLIPEVSEVASSVADMPDLVIEEAPEERELTTDEAIEEFIKIVSAGGSFSDILGDEPAVTEDGLPLPVFASEEPEADPLDSIMALPEDLPVPEGIENMDFEAAETSTVGSTDMNLRIAFGLEEEIDDPDEVKDAVLKMGDRLENDSRVGRKIAPDHAEYTDSTQARDIAGEYKAKVRGVGVRSFFATIVALVLLVFENIPTITELITGKALQFGGAVDPAVYPVVYVMVSLQLLFIVAMFALPELSRGVKRLFIGAPTPESLSAFLLFVSTVGSALTAVFAEAGREPSVYNAVCAISLVMTLTYSRLNIKREMLSFYVAGSKKKKSCLARVPESETLLTPDSYDDEDMYGDVMRVESTGFIDGFFSRMATPDSMTTAFVAGIMGVSTAAAVLMGIFGGKLVGGAMEIAEAVYITILALCPLATHLAFSYPFYRATKAAYASESAIVGEASLEEYASTAVVSFDDSCVFPSYGVKVQNIRIYNNARIDRVLYYASSAFKYAGGPLSDVFEVATMEMGRSENVEIVDADRGYLAAKVDGVNIVFGSYVALASREFAISDGVAFDDVDFSDELSVMYMFREDMLIAKFYIKYVLDGDIESILHQFDDYGMYVCVRTYDPNIDEEMICAKLTMKNPPIKVVRYRSADDVRGVVDRIDSGFVTMGSPKALLQLLPYCDKTIHTKRTCGALSVMSVIIAIMLLSIFAMSTGILTISSLHIVLYHLAWLVPAYLASKIFIR